MSKKSRKFKTDVQQLLDLVTHSLYSKKEIFLAAYHVLRLRLKKP